MRSKPDRDPGSSAARDAIARGPVWTLRGTPDYRRINAALFVAGLAIFSLLYCVQPLLPNFAAEYQVGAAESSLAVSLATGLLALSILVAGTLSDTLGRKNVMAASLLAAAVLNLAIAFTPNWPLLLLGRALEGMALGGAPAVAMAYLAEEIHPGGLGYAMGLYVGGTAIGGLSGRVITGFVAKHFGWRAAIGTIGVLGVVAAIGFMVLLPPSKNFAAKPPARLGLHVASLLQNFGRPGLPWLFLCGALWMGGFVTLYNYAGFRLQAPPYSLDQAQSGLVFSLYALGTLASACAGAAADRIGRPTVLLGTVATGLIGLIITLAAPLWAIIVGIGLFTVGFFGGHAVASGWVGRLAGPAKGQAASLYLLAYYLGSSLLGSIGGLFWTSGKWPAVVGFIATLLVMLAVATSRLWSLPTPDADR
ncbi:MFS transporter [Lichenihabitans psoromatis]|uniref:MFS transporter n=1 Tax=Lichenihabitans psoromatis TaxID=2528642 RepID=UPI0010384BCB|nr:MFS transporter [Lichenihabitans psoromatis]